MVLDYSNKPADENKSQFWHKITEGDKASFEHIFRSYYSDLYGYGLKLCGKPELVKDVIQELFVSVWERREELGKIHSLKVYLLVSLRRRILKLLYKEKREQTMLHEQFEPDDFYFTAEEIMIRDEDLEERKRDLQEALNRLPTRQKEVIYLRFYNGMSYEEIEEILSINYQSVRNHVHRAIKTLREILKNDLSKMIALILFGIFMH